MSGVGVDKHVHALGEQLDLPYPVNRALAWWIASELVRRHPERLRVIETHPGGGQYDCISVLERDPADPKLIAHLNLVGHITPNSWFDGAGERFNWTDVLAAEDRRAIVAELEGVSGLPSPKATPATTRRSIGPRVLSRFATSASLSHRSWFILNGVCDGSYGSDVYEWVHDIPGITLAPMKGDLLGQPAYRFWYILDHERRPFTGIDTERGTAWRRDGGGHPIDLMAVYAGNDGRIDAVLKAVGPDVE